MKTLINTRFEVERFTHMYKQLLVEMYPEGIYVTDNLDPVLVPGVPYYDQHGVCMDYGDLPDKGGVYDGKGMVLIPGKVLKYKELVLTDSPDWNVTAIHLLEEVVVEVIYHANPYNNLLPGVCEPPDYSSRLTEYGQGFFKECVMLEDVFIRTMGKVHEFMDGKVNYIYRVEVDTDWLMLARGVDVRAHAWVESCL